MAHQNLVNLSGVERQRDQVHGSFLHRLATIRDAAPLAQEQDGRSRRHQPGHAFQELARVFTQTGEMGDDEVRSQREDARIEFLAGTGTRHLEPAAVQDFHQCFGGVRPLAFENGQARTPFEKTGPFQFLSHMVQELREQL